MGRETYSSWTWKEEREEEVVMAESYKVGGEIRPPLHHLSKSLFLRDFAAGFYLT